MTGTEAFTGLLSLVGAGGVTSMVLGLLAYKTQALKGRRGSLEPDELRSANGHFPGSHDVELLTNAVTLLVGTLSRSNLLAEYRIDRLGEHEYDRFCKWCEKREMEATLAAFQAEQKERQRRAAAGA